MQSSYSSSRRSVQAYSSSSLSRQEISGGLSTSNGAAASNTSVSRSHYAVSSHVNNGNLVVDNGAGVIQHQQHGVYEENLSKFKGLTKRLFFASKTGVEIFGPLNCKSAVFFLKSKFAVGYKKFTES